MAEQVRLRDQQHTWTPEQDVLLKRYWCEGLSCSQVARALIADGCPVRTRNAIIGRVHRLGLPKRGFSNASNRTYQSKRQHIGSEQSKAQKRAYAMKSMRAIREKGGLLDRGGVYGAAERERGSRAISNAQPAAPLHTPLLKLEFGQCRAVADASDWGRPTYCGHPVTHEGASYCAGCASRFHVVIEKKPRRLGASGVNRRADYRDSARWGAR